MAEGIEIGVGADTDAFKKGVELGIIKPLEDADAALNDLGNNRGPAALDRSLEKAQDSTDNLKKVSKSTADFIEREYDKAGDSVAHSTDKGFGKAADSATSAKDSIAGDLAGIATDFDGTMESVGQSAAQTVSGIGNSLSGGVGLALTGAGAVAAAVFAKITADSKKMEQDVSANFDRMVQNGTDQLTALDENLAIADALKDNFNEIKRTSELTGVPIERVAQAFALGGDGAERMKEALEQSQATNGRSPEVRNLVQDWDNVIAAQEGAKEKYDIYAAAINAGAEKQGDRLQAIADQVENLPATKKVTIDFDSNSIDHYLRNPKTLRVTADVFTRDGKRVWV